MPHPYFALPTPVVIGHRGAAGERPENTLPSFEHALATGAGILESDVQRTRDGVPVLLHDPRVDRTCEGRGPVGEMRLDELRRLDAAHRFSADGGRSFPFRGRGIRVPTLAEALDAFPGARFNLELKQRDDELVERTLEVVERAGRAPLTLLTAGDDALMAALRREVARRGAGVAIGACRGDVLEFITAATRAEPPACRAMALQVPPDFGGLPLVTPPFVAHAHAHGIAVHVWTINEEDEMRALLALGVDGIVTDFPGRLAALLRGPRAG